MRLHAQHTTRRDSLVCAGRKEDAIGKRTNRAATLPLPLRNQLRGTRDPFHLISSARASIPLSQLPALAKAMYDLQLQGKRCFPGLFPRSVSALRPDDRDFAAVSLEREIVWATSIFLLNSDRLNDFLNLKRTIDRRMHSQFLKSTASTEAHHSGRWS
jgi:hypothetical protein